MCFKYKLDECSDPSTMLEKCLLSEKISFFEVALENSRQINRTVSMQRSL